MSKLKTFSKFLLEEAAEDTNYKSKTLILPPLLDSAPPQEIIEDLERVSAKEGDTVNETALALAMLKYGILNIEDILKYTKCFEGKSSQTRATVFNRIKVKLYSDPNLYKPYPGHEKYATWVGFKDLGEKTNGNTYRIKLDPSNPSKILFEKVGRRVEVVLNADIHDILSGNAFMDAGLKSPLGDEKTVINSNIKKQENTNVKNTDGEDFVNDTKKDDNVLDTKPKYIDSVDGIDKDVNEQIPQNALDSSEIDSGETTKTGINLISLSKKTESEKFLDKVDAIYSKYVTKKEKLVSKYMNIERAINPNTILTTKNVVSGFTDKLSSIIYDMIGKIDVNKQNKTGILLTGDPGVGKTSFVRSFADAVGLPLIIIEAPYLTKEHLINIPFLIKDPFKTDPVVKNNTFRDADPSEDSTNWIIDNSESNILTEIINSRKKKKTKYTDEYWKRMVKYNSIVRRALEEKPGLEKQISVVRQKFSCILFIDEYFRTDDPSVRNILRSLVNGRIGSDKLPDDAYCIFAANMNNQDKSFEDIPTNMQFEKAISFDKVNAEDWGKNYFNTKYTEEVTVAKKLANKVKNNTATNEERELYESSSSLKDLSNFSINVDSSLTAQITEAIGEELGEKPQAGLRLSVRRLEQIVLSINTIRDAIKENKYTFITPKSVNSFIRTQFFDYSTNKVNENLYNKISSIVMAHLGMPDTREYNHPSMWEETIKLQLLLKDKLGGFRKYPVVISGDPGIGKSSIVRSVMSEMKIQLIEVDAHTLTKSSVIGIPIVQKMNESDIREREDKYTKESAKITDAMLMNLANTSGLSKDVVADYMRRLTTGSYAKFSQPSLYRKIMYEYFNILDSYRMYEEDANNGVPEKFRRGFPSPTGKYKVALFIDELSRVEDMNIYNTLRRILLEGMFTEEYRLPKDMMIIGAMNPTDIGSENVIPLTDHMKDVLDIIPAEANWDNWYAWSSKRANELFIEHRNRFSDIMSKADENGLIDSIPASLIAVNKAPLAASSGNLAKIILDILNYIITNNTSVNNFGTTKDVIEKIPVIGTPAANFYWRAQSEEIKPLYHSPRNLTTLINNVLSSSISDESLVLDGEHVSIPEYLYLLSNSENVNDLPSDFFKELANAILTIYDKEYLSLMENQLVNILKYSPIAFGSCYMIFKQGLNDDKIRDVIDDLLVMSGVDSKQMPLNEYFKKYGMTKSTIDEYTYKEKIALENEEIVNEFGDVVSDSINNKSTGDSFTTARLLWYIVININTAIDDILKRDSSKLSDSQVNLIRFGIARYVAKGFRELILDTIKDKERVMKILNDSKISDTFLNPSIKFLDSYIK